MAGWIKTSWPRREKKLAAIVEEAIMQLVEVQRFAWGYYFGKVTAAGSTWLEDSDAGWLPHRWQEPYGIDGEHYNVAVRHCLDAVNNIYVWEWRRVFSNTAERIIPKTSWKRVPVVGSPYLITREKPWVAWMWDEPVEATADSNVIQLTGHVRGNPKMTYYHSIVDNSWAGGTTGVALKEAAFGLFGEGKRAHFYGGNAEDVFETEVAVAPAAKGEYYVDYVLNRVTIYENSPRPVGVKARYPCGTWPPGYHGRDNPLQVEGFGGVTDFYTALWHFSVKGKTDSEEDYDPAQKDFNQSGAPSGTIDPVDTFTELRAGIEGLCDAGMIWDYQRSWQFTFVQLMNRAGISSFGDLSRGVGRDMPDTATNNYGRTWTGCIGAILKCLEQMQWLVIRPLVSGTFSPYEGAEIFYQFGLGENVNFEVAKAQAFAAYQASGWNEGGIGLGITASTNHASTGGGTYICRQSIHWNSGSGRLVVAFDTQDRRNFRITPPPAGYAGPLIVFKNATYEDEFEPFNVEVYSDPWNYAMSLESISGSQKMLFRENGDLKDTITIDGPWGTVGNLYAAPINVQWETYRPIVFRFMSTGEDENLIPNPVPWTQVYRDKAAMFYGLKDFLLAVQPEFTFI